MIRLITTFAFALTVTRAAAATWYVDPAASGSNAGTSWVNAWQDFTNVVWGAGGVVAGDTLTFSGGYYTNGILVPVSGTASQRITVRAGQDSGHDGIAVVNGAIVQAQAYVTIDGEYQGASHLVLTNSSLVEDTAAIDLSGSVSPVLRYVTVVKSANGIAMTGGSGGLVEHCAISDIRQDFCIRINGRNATGSSYGLTTVRNCTITPNRTVGSGSGPDGIQSCIGLTCYSNTFSSAIGTLTANPNHQDFVQIGGGYQQIYANTFIDGADSCIDAGVDPGTALVTLANYQIYNNTFESTGAGTCGLRIYGVGTNLYALEQVLVLVRTTGGPAILTTGVAIENNIFHDCGRGGDAAAMDLSGLASGQAGLTVDYNELISGDAGNSVISSFGSGAFTQAHPASGTIDTGATLTAFNTDAYGVTRPRGIYWDVGPLEYSHPTRITIPGNVRIYGGVTISP